MRKVLRIMLGFLVLAVGLVLAIPGIPGPGIAIMVVGLVILAEHYHWARRLLDWAKAKVDRLRHRRA
jgi:uncharacterized protein (TIGR02611 family)